MDINSPIVREGGRWLLKTFMFGVGVAVGLAAVVGIWLYEKERPKSWDSKSITAKYERAAFSNQPSPAAYFYYVLENHGDDYSVQLDPKDNQHIRIGAKIGGDPSAPLVFGAVEANVPNPNFFGSVDDILAGNPLYVPAKQSIRIQIRWELPSRELEHTHSTQLVNESLQGFALFDDHNRIQIDFPKPPKIEGELTEADVKSTAFVAPDVAEATERASACREADRLATACNNIHVSPTKASFAAYKGYQVPLPELPKPPEGFQLEASPSTCDTAFQWKSYCTSSPRK